MEKMFFTFSFTKSYKSMFFLISFTFSIVLLRNLKEKLIKINK